LKNFILKAKNSGIVMFLLYVAHFFTETMIYLLA